MLCSTCLSTIWLHQAPLYSIILQFSEDKLCTFPVVHCSLCTELNTFHMLRNQVKNQISHAQSQRKKEGCRSIFDLKKKKKKWSKTTVCANAGSWPFPSLWQERSRMKKASLDDGKVLHGERRAKKARSKQKKEQLIFKLQNLNNLANRRKNYVMCYLRIPAPAFPGCPRANTSSPLSFFHQILCFMISVPYDLSLPDACNAKDEMMLWRTHAQY